MCAKEEGASTISNFATMAALTRAEFIAMGNWGTWSGQHSEGTDLNGGD